MATKSFNLGSLKSTFAVKTTTVNLGHATRTSAGGGTTVAKMAQIGLDGEELVGVSEQRPVIEFEGGDAKHRAAYVQTLGRLVAIPNESNGTTTTLYFPLKNKKIEDFKVSPAQFPKSIVDKATKTTAPDFEFIQHDDKGNVIAKAVEVDGTWKLAKYNMPQYKQRYNKYAEPITKMTPRGEERVGVLEDADGCYIVTEKAYTYCTLASITLVPGFEVSNGGTKIQGTDGIYLVYGATGDSKFTSITPTASAGKFSIKSLMKVLTHPSYGIASSSDVANGVLIEGKCAIDTKERTIKVYDSEGQVNEAYSKEISDRKCFKLGKFVGKGRRSATLAESISEENVAIKKEVIAAVSKTNVEDIF